jgi:hypothetical protein
MAAEIGIATGAGFALGFATPWFNQLILKAKQYVQAGFAKTLPEAIDEVVSAGSKKIDDGISVQKNLTNGGDYSSELTKGSDDARRSLRKALGLGRGNANEAHHIIPLGLKNHEIVQRAARGGFNFNGVENGVEMSFNRHRGVNIFHHNKYNNAVKSALDAQLRINPSMTDAQAAQFLNDYTNQIRNGIDKSKGRLR